MSSSSQSGLGSRLPREVFLSHASQDSELVTRIVSILRAHGIPVWYSTTNIQGAQQWHDEIGRALARCDWFVLALSPDSVQSRWVKRELLYALEHDRYDGRILPLTLRPCDDLALSWTLSSFQRVDFTSDFEAGCRTLMRVWGLGYDPTLA